MEEVRSRDVESIVRDVVDAAIQLHTELGPGLREKVYQVLLADEIRRRGHLVESELAFPLEWKGRRFDYAFRLDLVVERSVVVEIKVTDGIHKVHRAQVKTYLKLTGMPTGLLINFQSAPLAGSIQRLWRDS